jgi:hypothetical protein
LSTSDDSGRFELVDRDASAKGQDSGPVVTEDEFEAA